MVAIIALILNSLSLLDPVLPTWFVLFKQYFMKFYVEDNTLMMTIEKMKFYIDIHIKAYHLNHKLMSLYDFKYLQYSVTLSSRGWNPYPDVWSDLDVSDFLRGTILHILYRLGWANLGYHRHYIYHWPFNFIFCNNTFKLVC